ncbi:MAG: DsbE family thiol:disulfide interchange protein [Sideroxydans sp.]|nr:DsbE family thiol:disulfide interchange protein [Sideroxydans sp.]
MMRFILPFVLFMVLAGFLYVGLGLKPHEVESPLIDKSAPAFSLPQLAEPAKNFSPEDMKGKVWLFNVWASWCESCKDEHPVLLALAQQNLVPIYGLDYKDKREDAEAWLHQAGNPYTLVASDADGRVGINYGVYGVPETYVIDKQGVIRYKQIGPVTLGSLKDTILPLVQKLEAQP